MKLGAIWVSLAPVLVLLAGCATNMGIEPATGAGRGNIAVWEKNGLQARIYLDYRPTGEVSPHTFENVPAGRHIVHFFYENYASTSGAKSVVVAEKMTTEAVVELQKSPSGSCTIETEPSGAIVSLNQVDLGVSPLTLDGLPAGGYSLGARQGNFRAADTTIVIAPAAVSRIRRTLVLSGSVVIEYFSNTNCPGCPAASEAVQHLIERMPQYRDQLSMIAYHVNFPNANDPFYLYAKDDQKSRMDLYAIQSAPVIFINGGAIVYSNEDAFISEAEERIGHEMKQPATVEIALRDISSDATGVSGTAIVNGAVSGERLYIGLVEDFIGYPAALGTNNQRLFHSLFRGFAPEVKGIDITGSAMSVPFSIAFPSSDTLSTYSVFVVAQDHTTKKIIQSQCLALE